MYLLRSCHTSSGTEAGRAGPIRFASSSYTHNNKKERGSRLEAAHTADIHSLDAALSDRMTQAVSDMASLVQLARVVVHETL